MANIEFQLDVANDDGMRQPEEPAIRVTGDEVLATRKYPGAELIRWQDDGGRMHLGIDQARSGSWDAKKSASGSRKGAISLALSQDAERATRDADTRQVVFQGGNFSPNRR